MSLNIFYVFASPIISSDPDDRGHKTHIFEIIRSFKDLGHQVIKFPQMESGELRHRGFTVASVKPFLPDWLRCKGRDILFLAKNASFFKQTSDVLIRNPIDFIYERSVILQFYGTWAAKRANIPIILEINSPIYEAKEQSGLGFERLVGLVEKKVSHNVDAIVVVSGVVRDYLIELGIDHKKIHVIPNGVNADKFNPSISKNEVREKYGLEGKVVIGFVGSFWFYHGTDLLISVAEEIVKTNEDVCFLIVGGQNETFQKAVKYIQSESLSGEIIMCGHVPYEAVPEHIAAMDIAVLPDATDYGFPIKLCEYGCMGKPIIAPKVEAITGVFVDEETAFLFEPGNKEEFKHLILELVRDRQLGNKVGENARYMILKHHTWKRNAEKIIAIYAGLQRPG